jgi:hypothetical protein
VNLERRRISPRIDLPTITVLEGDAPYERGYHSEEGGLLPSSQTTVEETQEVPAQKEDKEQAGWQTKSFRQSRRQRHLVRALDRMPVEGPPSRLVWGLLKRGPSTLPELEADGHLREADEKRMAQYYAREQGGISWKWQAMDSKHCAAPLGGQKTGNNPTDRGKSGAKINLLVDGRGAPTSVVLTAANRHDTRSQPWNF